jgi:hypothetical protein
MPFGEKKLKPEHTVPTYIWVMPVKKFDGCLGLEVLEKLFLFFH